MGETLSPLVEKVCCFFFPLPFLSTTCLLMGICRPTAHFHDGSYAKSTQKRFTISQPGFQTILSLQNFCLIDGASPESHTSQFHLEPGRSAPDFTRWCTILDFMFI